MNRYLSEASPLSLIRHLQQLDDVHFQSLSQTFKAVDGDIGNAAFELRDIGSVELCCFCQLFLAPSLSCAQPADVCSSAGARSWQGSW